MYYLVGDCDSQFCHLTICLLQINIVTRQSFFVSESTMKSFVFLMLVVAVAVTDCAPSSMNSYEDFDKLVQFIKLICQDKIIGT